MIKVLVKVTIIVISFDSHAQHSSFQLLLLLLCLLMMILNIYVYYFITLLAFYADFVMRFNLYSSGSVSEIKNLVTMLSLSLSLLPAILSLPPPPTILINVFFILSIYLLVSSLYSP